MISMNNFWDIVKKAEWKRISKLDSIDYAYYKKQNRMKYDNCDEIRAEIVILTSVLKERILDFFKKRKYSLKHHEIENNMYFSDDTFWYLCNHIVGLGKDEYFKCINNPKRIFKHRDFNEGFEYIF